MSTFRDRLPDGWVVIDTKEDTVLVGDARVLHINKRKGITELLDRRTGRVLCRYEIGDFLKFCTVGP